MSEMPEDIVAQLRALGSNASLLEVSTAYAPLLAEQARANLECTHDLAYGPHPRHRLNLYRPTRSERAGHAILVMLHGGGFIRGDKSQRENFGWWAARAGFVAVLPNYRLAPECRWPAGPEDVVAIWHWLRAHGASLGGDPDRIVLIGESAGAAHVAAACLRRAFQPQDFGISAAVLLSGPYNARLEGMARPQFGIPTPDPRNEPYFGSDPGEWDAASIVDHVDVSPFPVLIGYAERDLVQMQVQAGELFARLVSRHGFAPDLHCWREHNHFSPGCSFGTLDSSVSGRVLDFVRRHTE